MEPVKFVVPKRGTYFKLIEMCKNAGDMENESNELKEQIKS